MDEKIAAYDKKIKVLFENNEACKRLGKIPVIGKLGATMLAAMLTNSASFKNGRHFAAHLGLTLRQHSSGGKNRLRG